MSDLILSGTDIKTTQEMARHQDPKTTIKYYLQVTEEQKKQALEKLTAKRMIQDGGSE